MKPSSCLLKVFVYCLVIVQVTATSAVAQDENPLPPPLSVEDQVQLLVLQELLAGDVGTEKNLVENEVRRRREVISHSLAGTVSVAAGLSTLGFLVFNRPGFSNWREKKLEKMNPRHCEASMLGLNKIIPTIAYNVARVIFSKGFLVRTPIVLTVGSLTLLLVWTLAPLEGLAQIPLVANEVDLGFFGTYGLGIDARLSLYANALLAKVESVIALSPVTQQELKSRLVDRLHSELITQGKLFQGNEPINLDILEDVRDVQLAQGVRFADVDRGAVQNVLGVNFKTGYIPPLDLADPMVQASPEAAELQILVKQALENILEKGELSNGQKYVAQEMLKAFAQK